MDDLIDFGNFPLTGYLPLIRKDSTTHMHGLAFYVKEGLPFARDVSLENSADSYLSCRLALLHPVPYFFLLYRSFKKTLCGPFLWMGFNCLKATEPLRGESLLFTTKLPEIPGTHLNDLGRMKG